MIDHKPFLLDANVFDWIIVNSFLVIYALAYLWSTFTKRDQWLSQIATSNILIAMFLILVMIAANNPLSYANIHIAAPSYEKTLSSKPAAHPQATYDLSKAKLFWLPETAQIAMPMAVLGYRDNHPIYACRTKLKGVYYAGELYQGRCHVIVNALPKIIKNYNYLAGPGAIIWRQSGLHINTGKSFFVRTNNKTPYVYFCRTIYNNKIYVGTIKENDFRCRILAGNTQVDVDFNQVLRTMGASL